MSWCWKEELEEKEYEVKGTVTISTVEYRDLISTISNLQAAGQKEHDDWYRKFTECGELQKSLTTKDEKLNEINTWFDECPETRIAFREWKLSKMEEGEKE